MIVLGSIAVVVLLLGGTALTLNNLATRKVDQFCSSISIGEPISNVLERAKQDHAIQIAPISESKVVFIVHGFVFAQAHCTVEIDHGLVKSKASYAARD